MDNDVKPKTGMEIQFLIDETVTRIEGLTAEQRHKDRVEGWNMCFKEIYEFVKRRAGDADAEVLKQFEIRNVPGANRSLENDPSETA